MLAATFESFEGFDIAPKADLIPGATASIVDHSAADNGRVLELLVPGQPGLEAGRYAGPGPHAIEVMAGGGRRLHGRYEFRVNFPSCAPEEELVSGIFTYFNDGSDQNGDGIADNSEIDVEHLCGQPEYLWLSVWTDYEARAGEETFRKSTRVVDMRTGAVWDTPRGTSEYGGLQPAPPIEGLALPNFPGAGEFHHLGFEWRPGSVRYFVVLGGEELELWHLAEASRVPERAAHFLVNLWHTPVHWWDGSPAAFPSADSRLLVDWVRIWE